ncbi:keratin, type I cytoskeletal 9-like [Mizuhopecten yessoensis]|uniref:keratin, type I cytoskeletal 9-like n=1 Tax=Mizuhopecten yessoensis TaxID=6573 RepID=UPI000B45A7E0|nr:keratin, type I cytoskeletal 9-like [Mizuhopecten yessoensis]
MDAILSAVLLILPYTVQGLFLDTMMSDCYGIPFMCNLKKKGDNSQEESVSPFMAGSFSGSNLQNKGDHSNKESVSPFMAGSFTGTGSFNSMQSQSGISNAGKMHYNTGQNPMGMTSGGKHDGEEVQNPFFQTQQKMLSGDLAGTMKQDFAGQTTDTGAENMGSGIGIGQAGTQAGEQVGGAMFGPGMVSGASNTQQFGPGGMSSNAGDMSGFPGTMAGSQGAQGGGYLGFSGMGGFPGSSGMSGGFPGGSGGGFPGGMSGGSETTQHGTTGSSMTTSKQKDGICEVSWTRCQQRCITVDPDTRCPVCTCG